MHTIAWWPTVAVLAVATVTDLHSRRVPNWLVLPFLVAGVILSAWLHGVHGLGQSFGGAGLGVLLFGIPALMGGMGMGDVKLAAAIGAWIGPWQLFVALVITGIAGGVMVLCWALAGGFLGELFKGTGELVFGLKGRGFRQHPEMVLDNPSARKMPYVPAIAIGTIMSFFSK